MKKSTKGTKAPKSSKGTKMQGYEDVRKHEVRQGKELLMAKPKLGTGKRFAAVERSAAASGARDPAAVAAAAGRKKYGAKKMAKLSARGRK